METTVLDSNARTRPTLSSQAIGDLSARYEVLEEVGRGGMGIVFKARHRTLDRLVALKVTLPGVSTERFLREARLLAQIRSPHVVTVHDCELLPDGYPMLVMEWVEGQTLADLMKQRGGALAEAEVLPWMQQSAEGILTAAEQGIIH